MFDHLTPATNEGVQQQQQRRSRRTRTREEKQNHTRDTPIRAIINLSYVLVCFKLFLTNQ
jgi:hypothetical protein